MSTLNTCIKIEMFWMDFRNCPVRTPRCWKKKICREIASW